MHVGQKVNMLRIVSAFGLPICLNWFGISLKVSNSGIYVGTEGISWFEARFVTCNALLPLLMHQVYGIT